MKRNPAGTSEAGPVPGAASTLGWLAALALSVAALMGAGSRAAGAAAEEPMAVVKEATRELFTALARAPDQPERAFLEVVSPHMDFEKVSKWTLGKHWRALTPAQREEFVTSFSAMIASSYASAIAEYTDATVEYLEQRSEGAEGNTTVRTRVARSGKAPLRIDYRLVQTEGGWELLDIRVEGISLVTSYRSSFNAEIEARGVEGLLKELASKTRTKA